MQYSGIVFAGLVPHPPIMVPEVGGEAIKNVQASIDAMGSFTERIIKTGAETVLLISPHAPLEAKSFVAFDHEPLFGGFDKFHAPGTFVESSVDVEFLDALRNSASDDGYEITNLGACELDHGTSVPLYFLLRNNWAGRVVALGYSFLSNEDHVNFGRSIRKAADGLGRPVALCASGDLSHRLRPGAPAGYEADAHLFDEAVVESIRNRDPASIAAIDQGLRRLAGECGYRSMLVALGAIQDVTQDCEVLSYEAPFGVGYMVAQMVYKPLHSSDVEGAPRYEAASEQQRLTIDYLPKLAREAVETYVREQQVINPPQDLSDDFASRAACFVSIKTIDGNLRGCIGTLEPAEDTLAREVTANAIKAATLDPRFPRVTLSELSGLRYSVDVLSAAEATTIEELDPKIYGVIVEDEEGRRGVLLPDLEGIDSTELQVSIASEKAGIPPGSPIRLFRFRVQRYPEISG